jgi:hypothetical protein
VGQFAGNPRGWPGWGESARTSLGVGRATLVVPWPAG